MAQRLVIDNKTFWLKLHSTQMRRLSLGVLHHVARALGIPALRSITLILLLITGGLLVDYLPDRDIDLFAWGLIGVFV